MELEGVIRVLRQLEGMRLKVESVERCLETLDDRDRRVLEAMFVEEDGNISGIMEEFGVTKSTAYRWKDEALARFSELFDGNCVGISRDDR